MMFYLLIGLCIILCMLWQWLKKPGSDPPEISGRLPFIGHAHLLLRGSGDLYNTSIRIFEECLAKGGVVKVYLGPRKLYVIADPEECQILSTCLQKPYFYDFMKPLTGNGLLTADVPTWKKHRKLLNPAFNQQVLNGFVDVFNSQSRKLVNELANKSSKKFDHEKIIRMNSLGTIFLTVTGVDADDYSSLQKQYLPRLEMLMHICIMRIVKFWLHNDIIFKWSTLNKIKDEEMKVVLTLTDLIVQKKKSEMRELANTENKTGKLKPFLGLILDLAKDHSSFTDEQVRGEINTIIAAGHDTTATTMTIALVLLGSDLAVQEKAFEEIFDIFGNSDRDVRHEDLAKLVYIEAILKETMRLYPIAPVIVRKLENEVKLRNYSLKPNSDCVISIYGIHRHKMWGSDVNKFKPERWLDKDTLPDPKHFAAFGLGRRSCIGKAYAMMSMKIDLVHILRRYRISSDSSKMVFQFAMLLKPSSGFQISLEQRKI